MMQFFIFHTFCISLNGVNDIKPVGFEAKIREINKYIEKNKRPLLSYHSFIISPYSYLFYGKRNILSLGILIQ